MDVRTLDIPESLAGLRVDKAIAEAFPDLSRSRVHALIESGAVTVGGRVPKAAAKLRSGERLTVLIPELQTATLTPEAADLDIVFEDQSLVVVNKPAGVVVHPGAGASRGTLAAALLAHCGTLSSVGGVARPGIVHRLDKGTSGLMVVAKTDAAHRSLSAQFKARSVSKIYKAICIGVPNPAKGSVKLGIARDARHRKRMAASAAGRAAHTDYALIETLKAASVVRLTLHSGRTHQIRVHMAAIRCPLVGDAIYGAMTMAARAPAPIRAVLEAFPRPALHSESLGFTHPLSGESLRFDKDWPDDLVQLRRALSTLRTP